MKVHVEKNTAVMYLPGFKYDDFDRAGILTVYILFYETAVTTNKNVQDRWRLQHSVAIVLTGWCRAVSDSVLYLFSISLHHGLIDALYRLRLLYIRLQTLHNKLRHRTKKYGNIKKTHRPETDHNHYINYRLHRHFITVCYSKITFGNIKNVPFNYQLFTYS